MRGLRPFALADHHCSGRQVHIFQVEIQEFFGAGAGIQQSQHHRFVADASVIALAGFQELLDFFDFGSVPDTDRSATWAL